MLNLFRVRVGFSTTFQELMQSSKSGRIHDCVDLQHLLHSLRTLRPTMHAIIFTSNWHP